jgi:hypothetical protein
VRSANYEAFIIPVRFIVMIMNDIFMGWEEENLAYGNVY